MSQTGMVVRTWKISKLKPGETVKGLETMMEYDPHWRRHMIISGFGAVCTFVVMIVFAVTKFTSGAWFIVLLVPTLVYVFFRIHHHYKDVAQALSWEASVTPDVEARPVQTVILVDDVHAETVRLVNFAKALGHPWRAIHVAVNPEKSASIPEKWEKRIGLEGRGKLEIIESPYRLLAEPIQDYIEGLQQKNPGCFVHVIMGHLAMDTYWGQALHQNTAFLFNLVLSRMDNVVVTTVPYQIHRETDETRHEIVEQVEQPVSSPNETH
jgi:hypothetical protein